uniref:Btz domain-containing protein n=1 Tax=Kalanchoe fedtschenkoi TaxID=63787 RepID=A0A7N0UE83_KALFE
MSSSRREARGSDSKRRSSSKYDREPSPKRSSRDGRHGAEKGRSNDDGEARRGRDYDEKDRRRRVEDLLVSSKAEDVVASKGSDKKTDERQDSVKKTDERKDSDKKVDESKDLEKKVDGAKETEKKENGSHGGRKHSSDAAEIPRTQSHFQHDDHGYTRQSDRSSNQRAAPERGWGRDYRDRRGDREANRSRNHITHSRDDKFADQERGDHRVWRHDGFFELEENPTQSRKRPAFSEQKIAAADGDKGKTEKPNYPVGSERDERGEHISRGVRRLFDGDRGFASRGVRQGFGPPPRDRFVGSGGNYRARDGPSARQGPHSTGLSDKWKHDLFSEANRSPTPKNEEDQIAKVEALLAS